MALDIFKKTLASLQLGRASPTYIGIEANVDDVESRISEEVPRNVAASIWSEKRFGDENRQSSLYLNARLISDATIGLSDGLTVPFALTAGLSAFGSSKIVIYGGMAELLAGCISMGLGGYLGAKSEAESRQISRMSLINTVREEPVKISERICKASLGSGLPPHLIDTIAEYVQASDSRAVQFLSKFEEHAEDVSFESRSAYLSAATIAAGYFVGGFIPLIPYFFLIEIRQALTLSIAIVTLALFLFGYFKARFVGQTSKYKCLVSGIQMTVLGGCGAAVAVGCVKLGSWWEDVAI